MFLNYVIIALLVLVVVVLLNLYFERLKRQEKSMGDTNIARLKKNTEKVFLDFDKCEFKSGTYSHEINDPNLESVKLIAPSSTLALLDSKISETVIQSYLTYTDDIKGEKAIFTSQSFPFDTITLKYHVLNKNVALYINRLDSRIYLFELNK